MSQLDALWKEIAEEPTPPGSGALVRRLPIDGYDVFLTQSRPQGHLGFLVRTNEKPGVSWKALRGSQGIDISVDARPGSLPAMQLTELDARFHDVFVALVTDLVRGLEVMTLQAADERPLVMEFLSSRIARWQLCLKANNDGLSSERAAGLFGELSTLTSLLEKGVDPLLAVDRWTGPSAAAQDFQFDTLSLEIKASRQTQPTNVRISSERQLDTTTCDRLLLIHFGLDERSDGSGISLPDKVAEVRALVNVNVQAALLLDSRLVDAGYLDLHGVRYSDRSYAIRFVDYFDVIAPIPRLVEADLPIGVGKVSYDLSLAACEPFRIAAETAADLYAGVAS